MIQRIQTLYLLIISVLSVVMLFLPLAVFQRGNELFSFDASGLSSMIGKPELIYPAWAMFILVAVIALLALITIFLYRKRMLQIRLCIFNAFLMIGFYCLFAFYVHVIKQQIGSEISMSIKFALSFPLINIVLDYLAIRNIGADEALIRSLNRLRH